MNRNDLDAFVEHYRLSEEGVIKTFELTHAIPTRAETLNFLLRVMRIGAVLSLGAGIVFFIAANWDALGVFGHFALVQFLFIVAVGLAWWRSPPHVMGRLALLAAFVIAGGLLALFGQTYQTGADVYELFFMWALFGLPLVLASQWSVCWAALLLVLNLALTLYCGFKPAFGLLGVVVEGWQWHRAMSLLIPMAINLVLCFLASYSDVPAIRAIAPQWLRRIAVSFGVFYATWSATYLITSDIYSAYDLTVWLILIAALGAVALSAFRKRDDVLPVAAIAGCLIFLGLVVIAENTRFADLGMLFLMAIWLIGTSTIGGRMLMKLQRTWRAEGSL